MTPDQPSRSIQSHSIQPVTVPVTNGLRWLGDGLAYFLRDPLPWIFSVVLLLSIMLFGAMVSTTPLAALTVLIFLSANVFNGGFYRGCDAQSRGQPFRVSHLFSCFSRPLPFIVLSVLSLCALVLIFVLIQQLDPALMERAAAAVDQENLESEHIQKLRTHLMLGMLPLLMALYFAPVLLALHSIPPVVAMGLSFMGVLRNLLAFLPLLLVSAVLLHVASLSYGILLVVVLPVLLATNYVAYRDIFKTSDVGATPDEAPESSSSDSRDSIDDR